MNSRAYIPFLREEIGKRLPEFLMGLMFMAFAAGLALLLPPWASKFVSTTLPTGEPGPILWALLYGLAIFAASTVFNFTRLYLMTRLAFRITSEIRVRLFARVLQARPRQIDSVQGGKLISAFSNDIQIFYEALSRVIAILIPSMIAIVGFTVALVWYNWLMALCLLLLGAPVVFVSGFFGAHLRTYAARAQVSLAGLISRFETIIAASREIKSLNLQKRFGREFEEQNAEALNTLLQRERMEISHPLAVSLVVSLAVGGLFIVSFYMTAQGLTDFENLTAFFVCIGLLYSPLQEASHALGRLAQLNAVIVRLNETMAIRIEEGTGTDPLPASLAGQVTFESVGYSASRGGFAFEDFNLTVQPGEKLAIVGKSGAGKTTLFELVSRFLEPDSGTIRIDGKDTRDVSLEELRARIGVVFQQPIMFEASLMDNLRAGNEAASDEDVFAAAEMARVSEFAQNLPQGFDTPIEVRGTNLSVGQIQRVAIARLFLKDPAILMLDEPTSALDSESERHVRAALDQVSKGRTTFIIAHRPSTVASADKILVLDHGRIAQYGTHAELMRQDGYYREFASEESSAVAV